MAPKRPSLKGAGYLLALGSALVTAGAGYATFTTPDVAKRVALPDLLYKAPLLLINLGLVLIIMSALLTMLALLKYLATWGGEKLTTPRRVRTDWSPGDLGHVTASVGVLVEVEGEVLQLKEMEHGPLPGGWVSGTLPLQVATSGPEGRRVTSDEEGEGWIWTFTDITVVNESPDHITCHAWLVVTKNGQNTLARLKRSPNEPLVFAPFQTTHEPLEFRLSMFGWSNEELLSAGRPKSLILFEVGSEHRHLSVDFEREDH